MGCRNPLIVSREKDKEVAIFRGNRLIWKALFSEVGGKSRDSHAMARDKNKEVAPLSA